MAPAALGFLPITQPLDLEKSIESGQVFLWRRHDGWFCGPLAGNITHMRQVDGGLEFEGASDSHEETIAAIHAFLRLNDPIEEILRQLQKDPHLEEPLKRNHGLRILRQDPWECLLSFVCSIDANIPRIRSMISALASHCGEELSLDDCHLPAIPNPESLAEVGETKLRELGLGFRAKYVDPLAKTIAAGEIDLEALRFLPTDEARKALMSIKGVGEKVADCALVFSLDKLNAFPLDRWVRRAVQEWYFDGEAIPDRAIQAWAKEHFGGYAGYAQQYLFYRRRLDAGRSTF